MATELSEEAKQIAKMHCKKQVVNETQIKVLEKRPDLYHNSY